MMLQQCKTSKCVGTTTMDHISQLPTDILCYVISKLSLRDAVRTRTLSHRWKCLSSSQSGLIFDKLKSHRSLKLNLGGAPNLKILGYCAHKRGLQSLHYILTDLPRLLLDLRVLQIYADEDWVCGFAKRNTQAHMYLNMHLNFIEMVYWQHKFF
ncbi:uncharacterized protein LOC110671687 isoform X4 [Hevea brasiliensis]|uniref:uncharacterized protein LOC110671687 isoform X4 n=1 Tax=Hevea brasiliensis TaxID=3981 RepID=UPI0025F1D024|nr:uncharacterized protein LOC110671687 isoform X4 [Hevea brasiliensis]